MSDTKKNILNFIVAFLLIVFLYFQKITEFFLNFHGVTYFDEIMMIIFFLTVFVRTLRNKSINKNHLILVTSIIFLVVISLIHPNAALYKIILQTFIHLKLFIFFYFFEIIFEKRPKLPKDILNILMLLTFVGLFASFLLQESFTSYFHLIPVYRYGFVRAYGFQLEVNHVAVTLSLYYFYFLFIVIKKPDTNKFLIVSILFIFLVFLTGSRTVLVVIPIAFFYIFKGKRSPYLKYFLSVIAIFTIFTIYYFLKNTELYKISIQNFMDTVNAQEGSYIRGIMIYYGINLAIENFPVGTGAASFGTVLSEGSPVYTRLGLDKMDFFIDMKGVYDSNIASILGEYGVVGLLLFSFLFYRMYISIREKLKDSNLFKRNKRYYLSILIVLFIYSISMGVMMNSYNSALFALFLSLLPELDRNQNKNNSSSEQ